MGKNTKQMRMSRTGLCRPRFFSEIAKRTWRTTAVVACMNKLWSREGVTCPLDQRVGAS